MKAKIIRYLESFERVDQFAEDHPTTLASPRGTTLSTALKGVITQLHTQASAQEGGRGIYLGGADERHAVAAEVLQSLRDVARSVRSLPEDLFPGVAAQFRITRSRSYANLRANLRAFLDQIAPVKAALIERGYTANFDELMVDLLTELDTATQRKNQGRIGRRVGTESLETQVKSGSALVKELDGIMTRQLRKSDPALLTAWKAARRIQRGPSRGGGSEAPAPAPQGSTPTPAPAPAPAA